MGRIRGRPGHDHLFHDANYLEFNLAGLVSTNSKARLGVLSDFSLAKLESIESHTKPNKKPLD